MFYNQVLFTKSLSYISARNSKTRCSCFILFNLTKVANIRAATSCDADAIKWPDTLYFLSVF